MGGGLDHSLFSTALPSRRPTTPLCSFFLMFRDNYSGFNMYSNAKLNEIRNPILRPNMGNSVQYCQLIRVKKSCTI